MSGLDRVQRRCAFTLRDMLVAVGVFALLLTVAMPWINVLRVESLQNHNRNQVKQLALALQNHNDKQKRFPPLFFSGNQQRKQILNPQLAGACYSWQVRLLPYLEESHLYKDIQSASLYFEYDSTTVQIPDPNNPSVLISPADLSISVWQSNHLNLGSPGECHYAATPSTRQPLLTNGLPDGQIIPDNSARGQSMARMADGTSKTILINETCEQQRSNWFKPPQALVCGFLPTDSTPTGKEYPAFYPYIDNANHLQSDPQKSGRTAINYSPYHQVPSDELSRTWGPSGTHPYGKMLLGMGDGSVQEVDPEKLDPKVYFAAITARDGDNIRFLIPD